MNHLWSGCILDSPTWKTCNPWEILETWDEVIVLSGRRWTRWTLRQHRQGWLGSFKTGCRRQTSLLVSWMFHMVMSSHPRNSLMLVKWDSHSWKWTQNRETSPGSWVICKAQNRINQAASVFLSAPPWCWPTLRGLSRRGDKWRDCTHPKLKHEVRALAVDIHGVTPKWFPPAWPNGTNMDGLQIWKFWVSLTIQVEFHWERSCSLKYRNLMYLPTFNLRKTNSYFLRKVNRNVPSFDPRQASVSASKRVGHKSFRTDACLSRRDSVPACWPCSSAGDAPNSIYWNWKARLTRWCPARLKSLLLYNLYNFTIERFRKQRQRRNWGTTLNGWSPQSESSPFYLLLFRQSEAVPVGVPDCGWPLGPSNTHSAGVALRVAHI